MTLTLLALLGGGDDIHAACIGYRRGEAVVVRSYHIISIGYRRRRVARCSISGAPVGEREKYIFK